MRNLNSAGTPQPPHLSVALPNPKRIEPPHYISINPTRYLQGLPQSWASVPGAGGPRRTLSLWQAAWAPVRETDK